MIQRIQSIFLFLAAAFAGVLFFVPIASFSNGRIDLMSLSVYGVENQLGESCVCSTYALPLLVLAILMTLLPLVVMFLYKKRELQLKLTSLNVFLNAVFCGLVFLYYASDLQDKITAEAIYSFGTYVPLINMVLSVLAMRWIRKDIELIKSVDRLR